MGMDNRTDDFESLRQHLKRLSDEALHERFWSLVGQLTAPLIEEARTHTSPAIERSVLLRMGFSSIEAKALVEAFGARDLLGHGVGRLVLELAQAKNLSVRDAGEALLANRLWEAIEP
jgi:D-ornithine 4,5-aminomutase subunit alpha